MHINSIKIASTLAVVLTLLPDSSRADVKGGPLRLIRGVIQTGYKLIPESIFDIDITINVTTNFSKIIQDPNAVKRNELLHGQLGEVRRIRELMVKQNDKLDRIILQGGQLLRKGQYSFPGDKLVVFVADFSSGGTEGREIADEIANHLRTLKKLGIEIEVLVGESRPGYVIRNEHMARDIGGCLPPGTNYVVIWGTLSPKTVGQYRPHVTFVQKTLVYKSGTAKDAGIACDFELELESNSLPLPTDPTKYRRECFTRLIGATCAAIPTCYAFHEISRDRTPNLTKLYEFLGEQSEATKRLKKRIGRFTPWTETRQSAGKQFLRSVSPFGRHRKFPEVVVNTRDGSVMALITDRNGKAIRFHERETGRKYVVYMDVLEVTNRQYVSFLNQANAGKDLVEKWIRFDPAGNDIFDDIDKKGAKYVVENSENRDLPIINVSWYGAEAYCNWARKQLPNRREWQAAGAFDDSNRAIHPSGDGFGKDSCSSGLNDGHKYYCQGALFGRDRSRTGCFDMSGNVAEWLADKVTEEMRPVAGGSWMDTDFRHFKIDGFREQKRNATQRWIGFRGVVRIPVGD